MAGFSSGNKDSGIGSIVIGGSLTGSQVDVGTSRGSDGIPGTEDDIAISAVATLGSVKIGGALNGLSGSPTIYSYSCYESAGREAVGELRAWMKSRNIEAEGDPIIAYYDAPF